MNGNNAILMPLAAIKMIVESFNLNTGMLYNKLLALQITKEQYNFAINWWQKLTPGDKDSYGGLVAGITNCPCITDIFIIMGESMPVCTQLVFSGQGNNAFLIGTDKEQNKLTIVPVNNKEQFKNTIKSYLDVMFSTDETKLCFKLPLDDFITLLALTDTLYYKKINSMLSGEIINEALDVGFVYKRLSEELDSPDFRWLIPSFVLSLPVKVSTGPMDAFLASIDRLVKIGIIQNTKAGILFRDPGHFMSRSFNKRVSQVIVNSSSVNRNGYIENNSSMYLRSERSLWLVDLISNANLAEAVITTLDAGMLDESLNVLLDVDKCHI